MYTQNDILPEDVTNRGDSVNRTKKLMQLVKRFFTIPVETSHLKSKTVDRLSLNFEYILMLVVSTIISTLGLLMNSSAIIIGGMILSPFMIPIFSLSYGIYAGNIKIMHRSLLLLVVSIAIALATAMMITGLSPLKNLTDEITVRIEPTLLDMFVALGAGLIGILVLSRQKIADNFAGVAIATSLVPPLSVAGIGLSLMKPEVYFGGFLLFLLNVLAITAVGTVYLIAQHWLAADTARFSTKALLVIISSLTLLTLPLTYQLINLSENLAAESKVRGVIERTLAKSNPESQIDYIETNVVTSSGEKLVDIKARITVDEKDTIAYELQDQLNQRLSQTLKTDVKLALNVQRSVSIASKEQVQLDSNIKNITSSFSRKLKTSHPDVTISNISLDRGHRQDSWLLTARMAGTQNNAPTQTSIQAIQDAMAQEFSQNIDYDISYSPFMQIIRTEE